MISATQEQATPEMQLGYQRWLRGFGVRGKIMVVKPGVIGQQIACGVREKTLAGYSPETMQLRRRLEWLRIRLCRGFAIVVAKA